MTPKEQERSFQAAQLCASQRHSLWRFTGQRLVNIGKSLQCHVPMRFQILRYEQLQKMSFQEIGKIYPIGSPSIDDLTRLLERIAEVSSDTGQLVADTNKSGSLEQDQLPKTSSSDNLAGFERSEPIHYPLLPVLEQPTKDSDSVVYQGQIDSGWECEALLSAFNSMRDVLDTHGTHPLLNDELREFLEQGDTEIPVELLGHSVREILEVPFPKLTRRWVGSGRIRCLLNLLARAVAAIRSVTGQPDENTIEAEVSLRPRADVNGTEFNYDGKMWRDWCEIIKTHGMQQLKLGQIAGCLRDFPRTFWNLPVADVSAQTLRQVAEMPLIGAGKLIHIVRSIRGLAMALGGLGCDTDIRPQFIPRRLHGTQDWLDRVLESREVPSENDVVSQLFRPLARQLQHDLPERAAQIAI